MLFLCYINYAFGNGDVAQLARAIGSYPIGRGFDPLRRYQLVNKNESLF